MSTISTSFEEQYRKLSKEVEAQGRRPGVSPARVRALRDDLDVAAARLAQQGIYLDTAWQELTLSAGWTPVALSGASECAFLRRAGRVSVNIRATRALADTDSVVAQLPTGFLPGLTHSFRVGYQTADADLRVDRDGTITVTGWSAAAAGLMAFVEFPVK